MLDAGIVDQDVRTTKFVVAGLDHRGDLIGLGHIRPGPERFGTAGGFKRRALRFNGGGVAKAVEHDGGAFGGQRRRAGRANA